ncbi:MAG: LPS export ABC transporter permease LptG [Gammaproteobacteria bacterium]|nr:LPS export ABC transporter permease LptG [Gammaproteobacteria bacterium]
MKLLDRYIITTILKTTVIVFFVLLGLRLLISFFGEASQFGRGYYGLWEGINFMALTLPLNMYILFPPIALLSALIGLGTLASSSELAVMRTSGKSFLSILWAVTKAALILIVVATLVGELFAPPLASHAEIRKAVAQSKGQVLNTQYGIWLREDNDFFHITKSIAGEKLIGITRYDFNSQHQLIAASYAKYGHNINEQWHFYDVVTSHLRQHSVTTSYQKEVIWPITFHKHIAKVIEPKEMPLIQLYGQIHFRERNGLNAKQFSLSFWERIFQPLTTLVMVLLAIPFVFGSSRTTPMGVRVFTGIIIGLTFYLFKRFFGPFSIVYQLPPILAATIPIMLFALLAIYLMWRKS